MIGSLTKLDFFFIICINHLLCSMAEECSYLTSNNFLLPRPLVISSPAHLYQHCFFVSMGVWVRFLTKEICLGKDSPEEWKHVGKCFP